MRTGAQQRKGSVQWRANNSIRNSSPNSLVDARIGVIHAPYQNSLNTLVDAGASALIAGHTHGGQVCLPGYGAFTTNCDLPRKQAKGLSSWQHNRRAAFLNVSAGLGNSIYAPVRFACRPEATLITLIPKIID